MAFFVSSLAQTVIARPERQIHDPMTGRRVNAERELYVTFRRREAPLWAREQALATYPYGERPPWYPEGEWVPFLDTDAEQQAFSWSSDEKEIVESVLRSNGEVIEVSIPLPEIPWPNYLELTAKKNLDLATQTATPVEKLLTYEQATRNDPKVLAEYQAVLDAVAEIEQIVEA